MRILSHNAKRAGEIGQLSGPGVFMVLGRHYRRNEMGELQERDGMFKKMTYEGGSVTAHEPDMPFLARCRDQVARASRQKCRRG
jgi:hypothetical protein